MKSEIKFPLFRKLENGLVYYQINSNDSFTELKLQGDFYSINEYKVITYVDRLFIADLIEMKSSVLPLGEGEFKTLLFEVKQSKKQINF